MSRFQRVNNDIRCMLHRVEYDLLLELYDELSGVISGDNADDHRFRRLFPPAVLDRHGAAIDPVQVAWRQQALTTRGRWLASASHHRGVYKLSFAVDDVDTILQFINDLRLMVGARIDIDVFDRDTLPEDDDRQRDLAIIDHLAWWQEEILMLLPEDE